MHCFAQLAQIQQPFLSADGVSSPSLGDLFTLSLCTEQLPETGSVYSEKRDRTALVAPE